MRISDISPSKKQAVRLRDGRQLTWHEAGASSGYPVIFCTGAGMSGSLVFGSHQLSALSLRLLAVDRPGIGDSDPHPHKTFTSWCDDIAELLQCQKIEAQPLALGFSQGAPFAFALAHRGITKALAIVAGQDDFSNVQSRNKLPPQAAHFVERVQARDQQFLEGLAQIATADGFFDLIVSMSSRRDQELYTAEPFASAYRSCLREGFRAGPQGYIGDLVNALGQWPFAAESITCPADFWYGKQDANPTHSPDWGAALSHRFQKHTYSLLEGEGGSLLWTRTEEILRRLATHIA